MRGEPNRIDVHHHIIPKPYVQAQGHLELARGRATGAGLCPAMGAPHTPMAVREATP